MEIESLIKKITKKHEALANPVRIHILSIVTALEECSWGEVKAILEGICGKINPNTLAFHIRKLMDCGLIVKGGSSESPIYTANISEELRREIEEIVRFYKEFKRDKK